MYHLTREEQETTVNWCAADNTATIDTADPAVIRKLDKLTAAYPNVYQRTSIDLTCEAKRYTVQARFIRFGKPASAARKEAARRNSSFTRADAPTGEG